MHQSTTISEEKIEDVPKANKDHQQKILPNIDISGLTSKQKKTVKEVIKEECEVFWEEEEDDDDDEDDVGDAETTQWKLIWKTTLMCSLAIILSQNFYTMSWRCILNTFWISIGSSTPLPHMHHKWLLCKRMKNEALMWLSKTKSKNSTRQASTPVYSKYHWWVGRQSKKALHCSIKGNLTTSLIFIQTARS